MDRIERLTDLQMAIMGVLWQQGEATVTQSPGWISLS